MAVSAVYILEYGAGKPDATKSSFATDDDGVSSIVTMTIFPIFAHSMDPVNFGPNVGDEISGVVFVFS